MKASRAEVRKAEAAEQTAEQVEALLALVATLNDAVARLESKIDGLAGEKKTPRQPQGAQP